MQTALSRSEQHPANTRQGFKRLAVILALALPLGACANVDRTVTGSTIPDDYHKRHPIVLTNAPQTLDVFVTTQNGQLDKRQSADLQAFVAMYRHNGQGQIIALVPSNVAPVASQATMRVIREKLAAEGVKGFIKVGSYLAEDVNLAAPIHLSFQHLTASLGSRCGEWPADLASGSSAEGWQNRPYYNLGCSTQQALAAQVDNPVDLVRPRTEDPADVKMRTRAIANVRTGVDPGTGWTTGNTNIGQLGN